MSWALISDSSCNLRDWQPTAPHTTFAFAPLKIRVGEREFVDDLTQVDVPANKFTVMFPNNDALDQIGAYRDGERNRRRDGIFGDLQG